MSRRRRLLSAFVTVFALAMQVGCATNKPEMSWVRTDGRRIVDDPDLLKQGQTDIALVTPTLTPVWWNKGGEIVWPRGATLSCAKTRRSKHEQDTRPQPLSVLRHRLRPIGKRATPAPYCGM
jgi:hypothetical protein